MSSLYRYLVIVLAVLTPLTALASSTGGTELKPQCGGPFQLCGYVEAESETLRIPQRYEVAQRFSEGLAAVRIDGLFGFIDQRGEIVISPRFQSASSFSGGYAEVQIDNASGAIDRSGRLVVPAQFRRLIHLSGGTFIAEALPESPSPQASQIDRIETLSESMMLPGLRAAGLYHRDRGWLTDRNLQFSIFDEPRRGLIWAGRRNEQGEDQWGLLRADGSWQVSPRYQHVQRVSETRAVVNAITRPDLPPIERRETVRWGAVDRNGDLVVPIKFQFLSYWRGGYGFAKQGPPFRNGAPSEAKEGIVKSDGSLLAGRYFDEVDIREDGHLPRGRIDGTWYSVTFRGRLIPDQLEGVPLVECESGLKIIRRGEQVEFRRPRDGRSVGRFDNTFFRTRDCPGPFSARRGDRWFFVLEDGTVLGGTKGFESTYGLSGSHAAVQVDGDWGIIDRSGTFTVRPRFAKLRSDRNNTFAVGEGESTYWIDATGSRVERPVVERPSSAEALTCEGGLRFFRQDDLWGLQDQAGQTVIEPQFRALSCFQQGVSWAAEPGGSGWCAIGPDGARREAMDCRETYYAYRVSHHFPEKFHEDPFESSVLWNRAWLDYQAGDREEPPAWVGDGVRSSGSYSVMPGGAGGAGWLGASIGSSPFASRERHWIAALGIGSVFLIGLGLWFWRRRAKS